MIVDRTQAPPFHLSTDYSLVQPEVLTLPGGQRMHAFRDIHQQIIKLELIFHAGKWFEGKSGVCHFSTQLLRKGTRTRSAFQIASSLDSIGAHLEAVAGFDTVTVSLFSLHKHFFKAMEILLDILSAPSFAEDELRQEKEIFIQTLRINNEKTSFVASREIRKQVFGTDHPYGNATEESDVQALHTADLKSFFKERFNLLSAYLVGPVSDHELNELLGMFPSSRPAVTDRKMPVIEPGSSGRVQKENSVQVSVRIGKQCIRKRDDPDYFDAVMVNHLLGGYFGSRLMKNIREEKGLTYGIHSAMHHFHHASFWVIAAEVNQQNTEQAIHEIHHEIRTLQEDLISPAELETARNYFIGSWQSDNATLFAVAEKVRTIHEFHLPGDYYARLLGHLQHMTPEQVQLAAQKHFGGDDLLEVRVGP